MENDKDKKKKSGRGFLGKLIVFLLAVMAFLGLIAMALSVLCSYINPSQFAWFSYFGLAFWVILFFNLAVFVVLLLMWSRKVWIAVLALLVAVPGVYKSFSTGKPQDGGELRVMSYNVCKFIDPNDKDKSTLEVAANVAKIVKENNPDVLCVQEFVTFMPKTQRKACIAGFGEMLGMPYQSYNTKSNFCNNVIFSKYPLAELEEDIPLAKQNSYGTVARVDAGEKGTFYVLCCHLVSFLLTNEELTVFSDLNNNKEQVGEYGKSIISKLKAAYEKRSLQVSMMLENLPYDGRPIIMCGDFNDTPMSYTYYQIKRAGFIDGFVKAGRGIGYTYAGRLPLLRIDYVWGNEQIQPMSFKRLKVKGSDHYPVMMDFNVKHGL